jgi:hypothetical protein
MGWMDRMDRRRIGKGREEKNIPSLFLLPIPIKSDNYNSSL